MNRKKHLALSCMALALFTAGSAGAAPIAIANANFEAVPVPDWYWVPDWDEGGDSYVAWEAKAASEGWSGAGRVLYLGAGGSGIVIVKYPYTPPPPSGTLISFF